MMSFRVAAASAARTDDAATVFVMVTSPVALRPSRYGIEVHVLLFLFVDTPCDV
jgi:hypothetical protein